MQLFDRFVALCIVAIFTSVMGDMSINGETRKMSLKSPKDGNCNLMYTNTDASVNYAALNIEQWDNFQHCGRCVNVTCIDEACTDKSKYQIVQLVDRCTECKYGDLGLSTYVINKFIGSNAHPSPLKTKWHFIDCPVAGSIKYCLKDGSTPYWAGIQPANAASGITKLQVNHQDMSTMSSSYYYLIDEQTLSTFDLSNVHITLTSVHGETLEEEVSLTPGECTDGVKQFTQDKSADVNIENAFMQDPGKTTNKDTNADKSTNSSTFYIACAIAVLASIVAIIAIYYFMNRSKQRKMKLNTHNHLNQLSVFSCTSMDSMAMLTPKVMVRDSSLSLAMTSKRSLVIKEDTF